MTAVSLRGVGKAFAATPVLNDITLDIAQGSFVSLIGPSGCGKSTLLRIIAGLLAPTEGTVERAPGPLGFVFQSPTLMPWATALENVALPLRLAGNGDDAVPRAALARVGLSGSETAYPHTLSGGMQMRVSIARATATSPTMLLMDEPFAALDEITRFRLNDDLLDLWQQNRWTVVFVTHSIREAVFLSQRVIVMSARPGRISADIPIELPAQRAPELRLSHAFTDQCAVVSRALAATGAEAA